MTLNSNQYGDPMLVLEKKQEAQARKLKNCGDCVNKQTFVFGCEKVQSCKIKNNRFGTRCNSYEKIIIIKKG